MTSWPRELKAGQGDEDATGDQVTSAYGKATMLQILKGLLETLSWKTATGSQTSDGSETPVELSDDAGNEVTQDIDGGGTVDVVDIRGRNSLTVEATAGASGATFRVLGFEHENSTGEGLANKTLSGGETKNLLSQHQVHKYQWIQVLESGTNGETQQVNFLAHRSGETPSSDYASVDRQADVTDGEAISVELINHDPTLGEVVFRVESDEAYSLDAKFYDDHFKTQITATKSVASGVSGGTVTEGTLKAAAPHIEFVLTDGSSDGNNNATVEANFNYV